MALPFRCESVVCSTLLLPYLQLNTSTGGETVAAAAATAAGVAVVSISFCCGCCCLAASSCNLNTPYNCFSLNVMAAGVAFLRLIGYRDVASIVAEESGQRERKERVREKEKGRERERVCASTSTRFSALGVNHLSTFLN